MTTHRRASGTDNRAAQALVFALVTAGCVALTASSAAAGEAPAPSPFLLSETVFRHTTDPTLAIHAFSRTIAPGLKASYGLGLAEDTELTPSFMRFDQTLAYGTRTDGATSDDWRHFLGLEYSPFGRFSLLGGIAKSSGITGFRGGVSPSGYERLRVNAGLRWSGESWGVDGSFSFIPSGASRFPGDASYFPGVGGSDPTYFFSFAVYRRF